MMRKAATENAVRWFEIYVQDMPRARKQKLFWDNAVKLYARCGLK